MDENPVLALHSKMTPLKSVIAVDFEHNPQYHTSFLLAKEMLWKNYSVTHQIDGNFIGWL